MRPSTNQGGLLFQKKDKDLKGEPINIPVALRTLVKTKCKPPAGIETRAKPCLICQEQWPTTSYEDLTCGHGFCFECLHHYFTYRLVTQMSLVCPCCDIPLANDADFWKRCNKTFLNKLQTLHDRISEAEKIGIKLKNPNSQDKKSKFRLCRVNKCKGFVDLTANKFQCSECKKQFCYRCYLPEHAPIDCKNNYEKRISGGLHDWKRCPQCDVFRETNDKCTHLSCQIDQEKCIVCISGWSDTYFHNCSYEEEPLPKEPEIWFRESIMQSSRFVSILRGVLMSVLFPAFFALIFGGILVSHIVVIVAVVLAAPFVVIYQACEDNQRVMPIIFFLCFPCGEVFAAAMITKQFWKQFTSNLPQHIVTYLLTAKSSLYYTLPYRQYHENYTNFAISSTCQRVIYLILMIILFPLLLLLVPLFFIFTISVVFIFTLLSLPVIAYKQKAIPIWVSVIFFPIVFFHFISFDYLNFFKSLLKEICSFYKIYCVSMCRYLTCQQPQEDNSCLENNPV